MSAKFNLVLSGGGARGYAHVGAIRALTELGAEIAAVSGASSGSLVGALYCDGYSAAEMAQIISGETPAMGMSLRRMRDGLLSFKAVEALMRKYLRSTTFAELQKPFFVSATNLNTGRQEIFRQGELLPVLCASSAIPFLLPPVFINEVPYGDAGMSNNLPVEPLIGRPEKIIGIHVNPVQPFRRHAGIIETIDRSMHIIVGNTTRPSMSMCDIFIEPPALTKFHVLDRKKSVEIMQAGYDHVITQITPAMLGL
jgi:NTE family protein